MSAVLTREQLRTHIDLCEALEGVIGAIDDVVSVEFDDGETRALDLQVGTAITREAVAAAHRLPPDVLLAGLQAMRERLEGMTRGVVA